MIKKLFSAVLITVASIIFGTSVYAANFSDVPEDAWYYKDVQLASEKGFIGGMSEDTFAPDENVTYAQFITILVKEKFGEQPPSTGGHWASSYINKAMESGMVVPNKENSGWDGKISRGRMAIFMLRSLDLSPDERVEPIFADSIVNSEYFPYLTKAYKEYLTDGSGFGEGSNYMRRKTESTSPMTRAQLASIILRIEKYRNDPASYKEEQAKAREASDASRLIEYNNYLGTNLKLQKSNEHFIFYSEDNDAKVLDELLKNLEYNYNKIVSDLKCKFDEKVRIYVCPDIDTYHKAYGNPDAPKNIVGNAWCNEIKMVSPLNPGGGTTYERLMKTVVHEFAHVAMLNVADSRKKKPGWFSEGLATYIAEQNYDRTVMARDIPTLDELENSDNSAFGTGGNYIFGKTIFEFINNKFGMEKLAEFIRNPDFDAVFGISKQEFENQWIKYVQDTYKK